jgi:hypothetical protein
MVSGQWSERERWATIFCYQFNLEVIVRVVDIGGTIDHQCLKNAVNKSNMGSCRKSPKLNQKDLWHALWIPLNHTNYARKVYGMVCRPNFIIRLSHILIANSAPISHRGCGFLSVFKKYTF